MRLRRSELLAFAAGLASLTQIQVIGYLGIVELPFLILAPLYLVARRRQLLGSRLRPFLVLSAAWLASALISDLIRGSTTANMLKGAFTVVLWIASLVCLYVMMSGRLALMKWYALGLAGSSIISIYVFQPGAILGRVATTGLAMSELVDFRTAYVVALANSVAALAIFAFRRAPRAVLAVMVGFAIICFVFGSRNVAGTYLVAAAMTYYFMRRARREGGDEHARPPTRRQRLRLLGSLAIVVVLVLGAYTALAQRGWLGMAAQMRYAENQSRLGLLEARAQVLFGLLAIADSPIIGYGSWAEDTGGYYLRGLQMIGLPETAARFLSKEHVLMPGHSHIVGTWVFNGLLGGVFWLFVFGYLVRFLVRNLPGLMPYLPYGLITILSLMWAVLASPFGARPATAASLVFLIVWEEQLAAARAKAESDPPAAATLAGETSA